MAFAIPLLLVAPIAQNTVPSVVAAPAATPSVERSDYERLARRSLLLPVSGVKASELRDTYEESRAQGRPHEALDIPAPQGTRVVAADDGYVAKLFHSVPGGITLYQFDAAGEFCYYYAHLDRYDEGVKEGMWLRRGEIIGYVGSTGNAYSWAPHLHFAIFKLAADKRWWHGTAMNPYPLLAGKLPPAS